MHKVKFFFYGTLMDYVHPNAMIETESERASALGTLFDLGPFPGALFEDSQFNNIVYGNMVTFTAPNEILAEGLLTQFDGYEGYNPEDLENSLYIRRAVEVLTQAGVKHECQTYHFNKMDTGMANHAEYVASGDCKKFKEQLKEASDEENID